MAIKGCFIGFLFCLNARVSFLYSVKSLLRIPVFFDAINASIDSISAAVAL
jgi:hypothetical protein